MSKPIFLTKEYIDNMVEEFRQTITEVKMSDGKIAFSKSFDYAGKHDTKAYVVFTPMAYIKMLALLQHFNSEVAWHGTVRHDSEDTFVITDVVVYPQTVTGSTVNTDQEAYQQWMMALDDDYYNAMRMQGHSHVNMNTSPSGVDVTHQKQILAQLKNDDYYIFMIWNKRLDHTIKIYDYANNVSYEDKDIVIRVSNDEFDMQSFVSESDRVVTRTSYASTDTYGGKYGTNPYWDMSDDGVIRSFPGAEADVKDNVTSRGKKRASKNNSESPGSAFAPAGMISGFGHSERSRAKVDWDREIFGDHRFEPSEEK